ncbi:MAG: DUF4397 domain-containing protein [Ginsengibacter sp.]
MSIKFFKNLKVARTVLITFGIITFTGCKKPGITFDNFEATNVAVIDYWNDGDDIRLDFSLDQSKKLHTGQLTIGRVLDYITVNSGKRKANFINSDDSSSVYSGDVDLVSKKVYSLFLTGTKDHPESVLTEDDIATEVPADNYRLRVANMNTDAAGKFNFLIANKDAPLATAVSLESAVGYKTVTAFKQFNEVRYKYYDLWAVNPGVDTLVARNLLLVGGRSYSLTVYGQKGTPYGSNIGFITNVLSY